MRVTKSFKSFIIKARLYLTFDQWCSVTSGGFLMHQLRKEDNNIFVLLTKLELMHSTKLLLPLFE